MVCCALCYAVWCGVLCCGVMCFGMLCDVLRCGKPGRHLISLRQCSRIAYKVYYCVFHMDVYICRYMICMGQDKTSNSESNCRSYSYAINDITAHNTTPCNILIKYYTIVLLYDYYTTLALYYTTVLYYITVPLYYYRQHTIAHHSPSHHTAS